MKKLLAVLFRGRICRDIRDRHRGHDGEAKAPCISTCINHVQVICCPTHPAGLSVGGYCNGRAAGSGAAEFQEA